MLEEGVGDRCHEGVAVKPMPGSSFEVIKPKPRNEVSIISAVVWSPMDEQHPLDVRDASFRSSNLASPAEYPMREFSKTTMFSNAVLRCVVPPLHSLPA